MLVSEAAKQIGMSAQTLRLGLQQRAFPFGEAIKTSEKRWTYHINPVALKHYMEGNLHEKNITEHSNCCTCYDGDNYYGQFNNSLN